MKYYLGIDGGGTKTAFTLADERGNIVGHALMGTTHYQQVGVTGVIESLAMGVDELLKTSGVALGDIHRAFFGLAAYDEVKADMAKMDAAVAQGLKGIAHTVAGDNVCGWAGSLGGASGANIVAGTGSIAYARNHKGDSARCGGWGHWFGGDEGSAYWIGCRLILAFSRQSDGREERTLLYQATKDFYHISDDFDIINLVVNRWNMDRSKVATLSKFAWELAQQGDTAARLIFRDAGEQLANIVNTCIAQVPFEGPVPVSYSGGVFKSGEEILRSFRGALCKEAVLTQPMFGPSVGAAILAMQDAKLPITEEVRQNLAKNGH